MPIKNKTRTRLLAILLLLAPFGVVTWLVVQEYQKQLDLIAKERTGVRYHGALLDTLTAAQRYRAERLLAGLQNKDMAHVQIFKDALAGRIQAVDNLQDITAALGVSSQWAMARQGLLEAMKSDPGRAPRDWFDKYRFVTIALNVLMKDAGFAAGLVLDPEADFNAVANIMVNLIPEASYTLGYVRGRISASLASGSLTPEDRHTLANFEGRLNGFKDAYGYAVRAFSTGHTSQIVADVDRKTGAFDRLDKTMSLFRAVTIDPSFSDYSRFSAELTGAIEAFRESYGQLSAHFDAHLAERQKDIRILLAEICLTLAVIFVVAGALLIAALRNMTRRDDFPHSRQIKAIVDTVLDGLITIDGDGIIQSFNPAAVKIFGYQPEEVIGKNVKILMPEPYHSGHDGYLRNYQATGMAKVIGSGREVAAKRKDGTVFPMELGVNEMQVEGRRMFVGTIRDITLRKEAEQNIQQYVAALKRSNQELDDFAYIASHDLKEPLRGLSNNAMFLKEDYETKLDEAGIERLARMTYLCQRMEQLVNDLLYFSRLGRQQLAVQETDLNAVIKDIALMMETTLHERDVAIRIPEPLPVITCDLPRVTEVFRNLITNAAKYNDKPEKWIEIGCTDKATLQPGAEPCRVFYVKDNGIGFAKEFNEEVFRIFRRLNHEQDSAKGTGVGLAFVRKIVERHNGRVWAESEPGAGSTFYFTLNEHKEAA